jgi:hypothetical protein
MAEEFADVDFNGARLEKRLVRTMETLSKQPGNSIWASSENRAEAKAVYHMLGNEKFDRDEILKAHREGTVKRMAGGPVILAARDTTGVNYDGQRKSEGNGYISDKTMGVNIQACLAVTPDGLVLGALDQRGYNRPEPREETLTKEQQKNRPIEEKESSRWLEAMETVSGSIGAGTKVIQVCGREGDMYELFCKAIMNGWLFPIRAIQNRLAAGNGKILDTIRKKAVQGRVTARIPRDSRRNIKARDAVLMVRFAQFEIKKPQILNRNKELPQSIQANVIYVKEEKPPKGLEPTEWFLMTNEEVNSCEQAFEKVRYYVQRWKIERFHYVLKSGCAIEKLQERDMEKTKTLIVMYSVIAVFILNLTYIARVNPELPCGILFDEDEWKVLYCAANRRKEAPGKPYTTGEAVEYTGNPGGPRRAPVTVRPE